MAAHSDSAMIRHCVSTGVLTLGTYGGVGLRRRKGAPELEGTGDLHHLPALQLRGGSALPHPVGLQPQAAAVAARRAPEEEVQTLGADSAERDGTAA